MEWKSVAAAEMVDLERFPVDDLNSDEGQAFLAECRRKYREEGACLLQGFIKPFALDILAAEAEAVADRAYFCEDSHTAYLQTSAGTATGHEAVMEKTSVGSIAYDNIPANASLRRLYEWEPLKNFIAAVLGKPGLYHFADPLGACSVNVFRHDGQHGWHFDESEFTVTLMLQQPEQGGDFEYVPMIRGREDEGEQVMRAIAGTSDAVHRLPFNPGTLSIFDGRQTLHRVTKVLGQRLRLVPVLCFSEKPGQTNSEEVRRLFWGRSEPLELQA